MACILVAPWRLTSQLLAAAVVASLAYYARPNGLFLLLVLLAYAAPALRSKEISPWTLGLAVGLFCVLSAPHLYARYAAYGSPFDYGENSKYFVDSYSQVWNEDIPVPSLWDYLTSHSVLDYIEKFVVNGIVKLIYEFYKLLGPLWSLFLAIGCVRHVGSKSEQPTLRVPVLFTVFTLLPLVLVFDVFDSERFFAPALPFALLIASAALVSLFQRLRFGDIFTWLAVLLVGWSTIVSLYQREWDYSVPTFARPQVADEWARWAAQNVSDASGRIAIVEGADLIRISSLAGGNRRPEDLQAAGTEVGTFFRPAEYQSLGEAYQAFRRMGVSYVFVDELHSERRPYLRDIYKPEWSDEFELIASFRSEPNEDWFIDDMDIFAVHP